LHPLVWFLLAFLNIFAASLNYQVGKTNEVIFNLAIASTCIIVMTLSLINNGNNYDNDGSRTKNDDKKDPR